MPHAASKLARSAGIDHRHRQAVAQQVSRQRPFQATRRLNHDQADISPLQRFAHSFKPAVIVTRAMRTAHPVQRPFERLLCHVHANELQRRQPRFTNISVCHIPSLQHTKCVRVTVRAWRQTQEPARPHALGRALSSRGQRAVQALANRPLRPSWRTDSRDESSAYKGAHPALQALGLGSSALIRRVCRANLGAARRASGPAASTERSARQSRP